MEETVGSSSSVLGYIASVDVKGSCDHHDTDRSLLAARASPDTPGPSSAWWCCPASLRGAPSQTASEGSPQRPRTPPSPRPLQSGGAQERSRQDLSGHCRHSPGRLSRRVLPLLPPGAGLCASLSWTVWSRWGDTSTPRACVSSRRPRTASRSALLQTTVRWTVMICSSQLAKMADRIKLIITGTLYTDRWLSLSSSSDCGAVVALLHTPLTSSSCMAHCFSFLATTQMKMTSKLLW